MNKHCLDVKFGSYECAVTYEGIQCDRCLSQEVIKLNKMGVKTTGSCCGHGKNKPFIQVDDISVEKMLELDYEPIKKDIHGNGENAYKPKSILLSEED